MKFMTIIYLFLLCGSIGSGFQGIYELAENFNNIKTRSDTMKDANDPLKRHGGSNRKSENTPASGSTLVKSNEGVTNKVSKGHDIQRENGSNLTTEEEEDHHKYYKPTYFLHGDKYFNDITDTVLDKDMKIIKHEKLSSTYKTADTIRLCFPFPFYGNLVNHVVVTTGGFINIGPKFHSYVHVVHYIAPLMANFNPSTSKNTSIYIGTGKEKFVVQWTNMVLNGSQNLNDTFTFQITLHKNGTVFMAYKDIPFSPLKIPNTTHSVTAGFADGFILSYIRHDQKKLIFHNVIYSYHKVIFPLSSVRSGAAYKLDLLPNCIQFKTCVTCMNASLYTKFTCRWCPAIQLCSDSIDWNRQTWLENRCDYDSYTNSKQCSSSSLNTWKKHKQNSKKDTSHIIGAVVGVVLFILILAGLSLFYYAYTHPQTKTGMWLIEHRLQRIFKINFNKIPEDELL